MKDRITEFSRLISENLKSSLKPMARPMLRSLMVGLALASGACNQEPGSKETLVLDKVYSETDGVNASTAKGGAFEGPKGYWLLVEECSELRILSVGLRSCSQHTISASEQQYNEAQLDSYISLPRSQGN